MAYYLGIDLGTTGLKTALVDPSGTILGKGYQEYPIETPLPGYAQQSPEDWWQALKKALAEATASLGPAVDQIAGIGLSGQMHGSVFLDAHKQLLCPAIVWCDQRSVDDLKYIQSQVSREELCQWVQNPVATGFQVCSLLWMRRVHPELYEKARYLLLPKDYIRYRLTGEIGTEATDACSTLLFDCVKRDWSHALLERLAIDPSMLPDARHHSCEPAGTLLPSVAAELGLSPDTTVAYGGGDQPMQAIGNGVVTPGDALVTLGTGGQIFIPTALPKPDPTLRSHMFCHAEPDVWYSLGAILNCCLAQNWFFDKVLGESDYSKMHQLAAQVPPGSDGLFFLPYLTGERTPHMNPDAKGIFWGMTLHHDRATMVHAVIEGIGFALLDALNSIVSPEQTINRLIVTGGGAHSALWKQILADLFGRPIYTTNTEEEACIGAAACAMVSCGEYASLSEACRTIVRTGAVPTAPIMENHSIYRERLSVFHQIYQANAALFSAASGVPQERAPRTLA